MGSNERHRRPDPGRPAADPRRRPRLRGARRELSRPCSTRSTTRRRSRYIVCRQEGGAAMMAEAYGKLTGRPGICFVTRGPGATNAIARRPHRAPGLDADDPVRRPGRARRCASARRSRRSTTAACSAASPSGSAEIDDAARIPEFVAPRLPRRDLRPARAGRAGAARGHAGRAARPCRREALPAASRRTRRRGHGAAAATLLRPRKRPFVILGGGGWTRGAPPTSRRFAEAIDAAGRRRASAARTTSTTTTPATPATSASASNPSWPSASGTPTSCSSIGARLGEMTDAGLHAARHSASPSSAWSTSIRDPRSWAGSTRPTCRSCAGMRAIRRGAGARCAPVDAAPGRDATRGRARATISHGASPRRRPAPSSSAEVMAWLRERLPEDAIVTNGAGNYAGWVHRFFQYRGYRTQLAPDLAARWATACRRRSRPSSSIPSGPVVAFAGDGCFLMTGQELATAAQYGAADHHDRRQQRHVRHDPHAPGARVPGARGRHRRSSTPTSPPTPAPSAPGVPAPPRTPSSATRSPSAAAQKGPALIEVMLDPEAITPRTTIAKLREQARRG